MMTQMNRQVLPALNSRGAAPVNYHGDETLLTRNRRIAFFCSTRCRGDLILKTYDLARIVRSSNAVIVGGFHTPIEKDCLEIFLEGRCTVVICPARHLALSRIPGRWQLAIEQKRLLLASPFNDKEIRATSSLAAKRNRFVLSIATEVFFAYAHDGSKTEAVAAEAHGTGKPLYTFDHASNCNLVALGAIPIMPDHFTKPDSSATAPSGRIYE